MNIMQSLATPTLYEQLCALPEGVTGEILNGRLHTQPRPTGRHARVTVALDRRIGGPYDDGGDGPGGWWILIEPEVHFVRDTEVAVPDLAGWRRERMATIPEGHRFEVAPDWICEILSPSTAGKDREDKMPIYARYGVRYLWLVDPRIRTLEAYRLEAGGWVEIGCFGGDEQVAVAPFEAVSLALKDLWV